MQENLNYPNTSLTVIQYNTIDPLFSEPEDFLILFFFVVILMYIIDSFNKPKNPKRNPKHLHSLWYVYIVYYRSVHSINFKLIQAYICKVNSYITLTNNIYKTDICKI